jgi:hypothetical protein
MYAVLLVCFGDLGVVLCCNGFVAPFLFWVFLIAMNMHAFVCGAVCIFKIGTYKRTVWKTKGLGFAGLLESYMQFETCRSKSDMTVWQMYVVLETYFHWVIFCGF